MAVRLDRGPTVEASEMTPDLRLGTATVDLTPVEAVGLAGFGERRGVSAGIASPLRGRVLAFRQGLEKVLLVSADLIWWGTDQVAVLRPKLAKRWGFAAAETLLHATHTHSGPQTSRRFSPALGVADAGYLALVERRLAEGIERALGAVEPVTVERGIGECRIGINRRLRVDDRVAMAPNERGLVDPEVIVIRFRTVAGAMKAVLVHYACHPTTTGDNLVSAEFPGAAMAAIERAVGGGVTAAFLQGCCGDIRPALIRRGTFYRGHEREVRMLGQALARQVVTALGGPMESVRPGPLRGRLERVELPFAASGGRATLELTLLDLAEGVSLLGMNAEMVVAYGLFVKERFGGRVLPVAYSNGMLGYVPTARQLGEGGYEAAESVPYFNLPGPFAPAVERAVRDGIVRLVEGGGAR